MKKSVVAYSFVLIITICLSFASAGWFSDFFGQTTGKAISGSSVPAPSKPTSDYLVGAFYMPMRSMQEPYDWSWPAIISYPERKPVLGYFEEDNTEVKDWEIKWALESGINFFIFDWYRCSHRDYRNSSWINTCNADLGKKITADKLYLGEALNEGFLKADHSSKMNFTIMLTSIGQYSPLFNSAQDLSDNLMPFIIDNYFKKPNYLKIEGKPVLFVLGVTDLENYSGSTSVQNAKNVVNIIRQKTTAAGFPGVILMGGDGGFTNRNLNTAYKIREYGFDYIFTYNTLTYLVGETRTKTPNEAGAIQSQYESYNYLFNAYPKIPFIITASPFWNSYAFDFDLNPYSPKFSISTAGFRTLLSNLKGIMNSIPSQQLGNKMILVDAWNEYVEGHYIAPVKGFGFGYLTSIRDQLTNKDNSPDYRFPSQLGLGPYENQYNSYIRERTVNYSTIKNSTFTFSNPLSAKEILYLNFPLEQTTSLSFGAWVNPEKFPNGNENTVLFGKGFSFRFVLGPNGSGHCIVATQNNKWYTNGTTASWSSGKVPLNKWSHLVCVYEGTKVSAYINGVKVADSVGSISGKIDNVLSQFNLGDTYASSTNFFKGRLANIFLENRALSQSEITLKFTEESSPIGNFESVSNGLLKGWVYDKTNESNSVNLHFYLDETSPCTWSASNHLVGNTLANKYRPEIEVAKQGYGDYHGFEYQLTNIPEGTHKITVYAIDTAPGKTKCLGNLVFTSASATGCSASLGGVTFTGTNNTIGLIPNKDTRFICLNNRFYECGWDLTNPAFAIEATNNQIVGEYRCDLINKKWVENNNIPLSCSYFTYSDWSGCISGQQTRTVISSSPAGCTGGNPLIAQNCNSDCVAISWIPELDSVCSGTTFEQTSNCGSMRSVIGTKICIPSCVVENWTNIANYQCSNNVRQMQQTRNVNPAGCDSINQWINFPCSAGEVCEEGICATPFSYNYYWSYSDWNICSGGNCAGGGVQDRIVQCVRDDGTAVEEVFCTGPKPILVKDCVSVFCSIDQSCIANECLIPYTYSWNAELWPVCNVDCSQSRIVECKRNDNITVSDLFCVNNEKPLISQPCDDGNCQRPIVICNLDSDCGNDYFTNNFCNNQSVYSNSTTFSCKNPGTAQSYCSNTTSSTQIKDCSKFCFNGICHGNSILQNINDTFTFKSLYGNKTSLTVTNVTNFKNLENLSITESRLVDKNYILIQNLTLESNQTKIIYLERANLSSNAVCIVDSEEVNISNCTVKFGCPGKFDSYSCNLENNTFVVSGLLNSFVIEDYIFYNNSYCGDSFCNNGETCGTCSLDCFCEPSNGGGSGGGSSSNFVNITNTTSGYQEVINNTENVFNSNESSEEVTEPQTAKNIKIQIAILLLIVLVLTIILVVTYYFVKNRDKNSSSIVNN